MDGPSTLAIPIKLLVIEDSKPVRTRMVAELHEMPAVGEVIEAGDLAAARIALSAGMPDVVILDVQLPDGSGLEVLRTLREGGSTAGVIIFSHLTSRLSLEPRGEPQLDFVFHKSADFEDVKAAVRLLAARPPRGGAHELAGPAPRSVCPPLSLSTHHDTPPPAPHPPRLFRDPQFRDGAAA